MPSWTSTPLIELIKDFVSKVLSQEDRLRRIRESLLEKQCSQASVNGDRWLLPLGLLADPNSLSLQGTEVLEEFLDAFLSVNASNFPLCIANPCIRAQVVAMLGFVVTAEHLLEEYLDNITSVSTLTDDIEAALGVLLDDPESTESAVNTTSEGHLEKEGEGTNGIVQTEKVEEEEEAIQEEE